MAANETADGLNAVAVDGTGTGESAIGVRGTGDAVGVWGLGIGWHGVVGISHSTTGGFGCTGSANRAAPAWSARARPGWASMARPTARPVEPASWAREPPGGRE